MIVVISAILFLIVVILLHIRWSYGTFYLPLPSESQALLVPLGLEITRLWQQTSR